MKTIIILFCLALSACGHSYEYSVGQQGPVGPMGPAGNDGVGCSVTSVAPSVDAPNGGSLITCATTSSLVLNGTNGSNGAPGTPGTVITSVNLCPGVTVYPSKFIEVAFCMNNKLYGVYSQNGGFMTYFPQGYYSSNGINASCSFTIGANCSVVN